MSVTVRLPVVLLLSLVSYIEAVTWRLIWQAQCNRQTRWEAMHKNIGPKPSGKPLPITILATQAGQPDTAMLHRDVSYWVQHGSSSAAAELCCITWRAGDDVNTLL